ncbi:hypothetical protein MASR2M66_33240 [Chloroflexota bacterium]
MTSTFSCPACGAPNEPQAGGTYMACAYCSANLTIPAELRMKKPTPSVEFNPLKAAQVPSLRNEAPDLLRKAEPVLVKAWNTYAAWTWLRWLFPTCLLLFILGCVALGIIPLIWGLTR